MPTPPAGYRWGPVTLPAASGPMASAGAQTLTIVNTLMKDTVQPRTPAPVPTNAPLALGGLSALIGMTALLRQRRSRKHTS